MVRPVTDPHGWKTVSAVTTPGGRSGSVVVVVVAGPVVGVVPPVPSVGVVVTGANVVTEPSGSAEITFPPSATHAEARRAIETRKKATLRIGASVETDPR